MTAGTQYPPFAKRGTSSAHFFSFDFKENVSFISLR